jgi:Bacterial Ig-like domain (group 2)
MKNKLFRLIGYFFIVTLTATLTLVPACTSVPNPEATTGVTLSSIKVSMASNSSLANALRVFFDIFNPTIKEYMDYPAVMRIGSKEQFVAVGTYSDTAYSALASQVTWSSSNTAVATISAGGLVSAVANGTTNITATLSGITSPSLILTVGSPNSAPSSDLSIANVAPVSVSSRIADNKSIDYSDEPNRN